MNFRPCPHPRLLLPSFVSTQCIPISSYKMMKINQSKNHITAYPITNHKHIPSTCMPFRTPTITTTANNNHSKRLLFPLLIIPHAHYSLFNPLINPVVEVMLNTLSTRYSLYSIHFASHLISSHPIFSPVLSSPFTKLFCCFYRRAF